MKKQLLFLIYLSFSSIVYSQNVFNGHVRLKTQKDVTDFAENNYDEINGYLIIRGENSNSITDLSSLQNLKKVTSLYIEDNHELTTLTGLHNISDSIYRLQIRRNGKLKDLIGLNGIAKIAWSTIMFNDGLESFVGLKNVSNISLFEIYGNASLKNLSGMDALHSVSHLIIHENASLIDLSGLDGLGSITGSGLSIHGNNSLFSLKGLDNLGSFRGRFIITSNPMLTNFCSLYNLLDFGDYVADSYTVNNNLENPTVQDILDNCVPNILKLVLPREGDVYNSEKKIRLQFGSIDDLDPNVPLNISYSIDNGETWIFSKTSKVNADTGGLNWKAPIVSIPTNVIVKVETMINNVSHKATSKIFTIQPINYYSNLGFFTKGVSQIDIPFEKSKKNHKEWKLNKKISTAHTCAEKHAQDWVIKNRYIFIELCEKEIYAPFDGKIIHIEKEYEGLLCGSNLTQSGGKRITIQSDDDKTFAMNFGHLSHIKDGLEPGMSVKKGDLIAKAGGSGTKFAHIHSVLYKNIYSSYVTQKFHGLGYYRLIDLLQQGFAYYENEQQRECLYAKRNFSARFKFIKGNTKSSTESKSNIRVKEIDTIQENSRKLITIFPNPVKETLNVSFETENLEIYKITLFTVEGKIIDEYDARNNISFIGVPKGLYYLKISTNYGTKTFRVMKE